MKKPDALQAREAREWRGDAWGESRRKKGGKVCKRPQRFEGGKSCRQLVIQAGDTLSQCTVAVARRLHSRERAHVHAKQQNSVFPGGLVCKRVQRVRFGIHIPSRNVCLIHRMR